MPRNNEGARVVDATITFEDYPMRSPLVLTGGTIEEATEARCTVTIEDQSGKTATGSGTVFLSAIWAWPKSELGFLTRVDAMQQMCIEISDRMPVWCADLRHPLEHGMELHERVDGLSIPVGLRLFITERIPTLAALVCWSPFDQALHDAYGRLLGISSYDALGRDFLPHDLSRWLGEVGEGRYLDEFIYRRDREELDAWLVIGINDTLREADARDLGDDLPSSVEGWIARCGYRCFKLKTKGADPQAEAEWVAEVYREVVSIRASLGLTGPVRYEVDANEGAEGPWVVTEFLDALQAADPQAYEALDYLEQPTERDIAANRWDMAPIARRKPVLADEGVTSLDELRLATELGWSGPALKTCKGHSLALLEIAWCELTGRPYALQDLTNPNIGAVHAAGLAAHCSTCNGVELNVMQFIPASSTREAERFPGIFEVRDGVHRVDGLSGIGLGY
ncbi:MAG: mandelate racemase/muconate lactonizing enzyme family protein [candidate division WS1 bacterium]|nr:mandelate racemase/muconate lactonizing enzyme family protein [candidate division WS1 bacterium]